MTKLERKLCELGYELDYETQERHYEMCCLRIYRHYLKPCNKYFHLKIVFEITTGSITSGFFPIKAPKFIWQSIKYNKLFKQAFNQLQNDLKELKKYENI